MGVDFKLTENPPVNGGFCSIFRTIGCIGDSLSSGELESCMNGIVQYNDFYEYSWGQFIARACGSTAYNFSRGGLTAKEFVENIHQDQLNIFDPKKKCQAYIIALGYNDISAMMREEMTMGTVDDINVNEPEKNAESYAGYMGRILSFIKQIEHKARVFLVTMPAYEDDPRSERKDQHAKLMYQLAQMYEYTFVIDLRKYAPIYDAAFKKVYYVGNHMNVMGYYYTANMLLSYIDWIIRNEPDKFLQSGFIGCNNNLHNENAIW